jgi:large subunit ribosomal protein L33
MNLPLRRGFFCVAYPVREINSDEVEDVRLGTAEIRQYYREENMRVRITMACTECKQRNYDTMKNKKNDPDRLEMSKYCRFCKKHTVHKESK